MSFDFRDQRAVITGASSGIGEAFARTLAARGAHVVLVARSQQRLEALAQELATQYQIDAVAWPADLSTGDGLERVRGGLADGPSVDILVNNAGFGGYGPFQDIDVDRERTEVSLNCFAPVALTKAFLPGMLERGRGAIVNVASTAAFQPTPGMAVYGASKAFVLSFSESIWAETRGHGVRVVALCPGPTRTNFFANSGNPRFAEHPMLRLAMPAQRVVGRALRAVERDRCFAVPGLMNYAGAWATRFGPRSLTARLSRRIIAGQRL